LPPDRKDDDMIYKRTNFRIPLRKPPANPSPQYLHLLANLWRRCESKMCKRARRCCGDPNVCFSRWWP
jgi:hypothetical protein